MPNCHTDSVSVMGPGLGAPLQLACAQVTGASFGVGQAVSASGLLPPLTYTFTAALGGRTTTSSATVNCYLDLPAGTAPPPGATVPSPVALTWTRPAAGIEYQVGVSGPESKTVSLVDQSTTTVTLTTGTYSWTIAAAPVGLYDGSSAQTCGSEWSAGFFTVQ